MKNQENEALDPHGQVTLEVISEAGRFNRWMYETIRPFCSGTILEIGSGIGNISKYFLDDGQTIVLSDLRKNYLNQLEKNFSGYDNLLGIVQLDLVDPAFGSRFASHHERYNTLFALNVVEHIENDDLAIQNARSLLRPGGRMIILVPAFNFLYNGFDLNLGHHRRYSRHSLETLLERNHLEVIRSRYFNLAGIAGWFVSGKLMKKDTIPGGQMKLYNSLVPVFRWLDKISFYAAGLSVIAVGRRS